ncbi:hypothetical protein [Liquorilactobacillus vini]|uniref:Uncharacterized protein n=1 Tax=Liquorilactobacillus vini DSM 20605 TaxID=1133569 RepID=A0A0R2BZH2_9LACO|nr:hypothetical protein [Liquorilactobacillus vini]KRM84783.1 hypothetical protein FD21_GL001921 [Liquorilactobacillus vini DSM 20605]
MILLIVLLLVWLSWKLFKGFLGFLIPLVLIVIGFKLLFGLWWLWLSLFLLVGGSRFFQQN